MVAVVVICVGLASILTFGINSTAVAAFASLASCGLYSRYLKNWNGYTTAQKLGSLSWFVIASILLFCFTAGFWMSYPVLEQRIEVKLNRISGINNADVEIRPCKGGEWMSISASVDNESILQFVRSDFREKHASDQLVSIHWYFDILDTGKSIKLKD